jgi:hypothetical protein
MRRAARLGYGIASLVLLQLVWTPPLAAQQLAVVELRGRVLLDDVPLPSTQVILHRVGSDTSGPLDSLNTRPDGSFRFRLPSVPGPGVEQIVYFASVLHDGVSYFGSAVHLAVQLDTLYEIRVYDTEPTPVAGAALPLQARYMLLEEHQGFWTATDLLQVNNPGQHTLVAAAQGVTWAYPLPEGASDLEIGGGEMTSDAAELIDGHLRVMSSIPPGMREFVVRYRLADPFVTLSLPGFTGEMELLVREPAPPLEVAGLQPLPPVEMEQGVTYRRFVEDSLQDATVTLSPGPGQPVVPTRWLAVGIAFVLAIASLYSVLRPRAVVAGHPEGPVPTEITPFERRQMLLLEIARLDESRAKGEIALEEEWVASRRVLLERVQELR